jgi:hypothetical protein
MYEMPKLVVSTDLPLPPPPPPPPPPPSVSKTVKMSLAADVKLTVLNCTEANI